MKIGKLETAVDKVKLIGIEIFKEAAGTLNTFCDTFTDIKNGKISFNSIDDVIKIGINSVDDLMKLGVNSVDDLAKLKVSSIDDLAKIGIKNADDLAKLGIDSNDLKKLGIDCKLLEEVNNPITKSEYRSLRKKTPSNDIRKMVNPEGPKIDPVYGYVTDVLEADHIVPMKEIVNMPGFSQLSKEQQIEILNLKDNFIGLGKSTNASKGAKNWTEWVGHSKLGEVPSKVRSDMLKLEKLARKALQKGIEERLKR